MKISIVIPAHNEEKRIRKTLDEYGRFFEKIRKEQKDFDFEILIVINNTQDKTEDIVKDYSKKYKEIIYLNFERGGKGFAVIEGFKDSLKRDNDLIGFVDADNSTDPEAFYDLVEKIQGNDGVIASRYMKGSKVEPKQTKQRIIASRVFNFLIKSLFLMTYKDTQCGGKLFTRRTVEEILSPLTITKWAFDVDLLYNLKKKRFKILETPTIWRDKEYSHVNFKKAAPLMALAVIRLRILNSPFKNFIKIYDKMSGFLKPHHRL